MPSSCSASIQRWRRGGPVRARQRGRACASSAGPRSGGRSGWRPARRRRGSRPGPRFARACQRRRATRRRIPRRSPSSPAAGRRGTPWTGPRSSRRGRTCRACRRRRRSSCRTRARSSGCRRRQPGQVTERPPARNEDLLLRRQVGAARLDQRDDRQPVGQRDVVRRGTSCARSTGLLVPPRTVGSLAEIRHSTPSTTPIPVTTLPPTANSVPTPQAATIPGTGYQGPAVARSARGPGACHDCGGGRCTSARRPRSPWPARPRFR